MSIGFTPEEEKQIFAAKEQIKIFVDSRLGVGWADCLDNNLMVMSKLNCVLNSEYDPDIFLYLLNADQPALFRTYIGQIPIVNRNAQDVWKDVFGTMPNTYTNFSKYHENGEERLLFYMNYNISPANSSLEGPLCATKKVRVVGTKYRTREELMQHRFFINEQFSYSGKKLYINRKTFDKITKGQ